MLFCTYSEMWTAVLSENIQKLHSESVYNSGLFPQVLLVEETRHLLSSIMLLWKSTSTIMSL